MHERYYERRLPHWQPEGRDLFITFRLSGSLPDDVMAALRGSKTQELGKRFREFDRELDKSISDPLWLKEPRIADVVDAGIRNVAEQGLCRLHTWVVMPNHVHLLLTPLAPIAVTTRAIKGPTARQANLLLGRTGSPFWQDESFDHWIRDEGEFEKVKRYIERNPVVAGLAKMESDWIWSSAWQGGHEEQAEACATVKERERRTG
jgi:REP element-mobilizing transposase RayT